MSRKDLEIKRKNQRSLPNKKYNKFIATTQIEIVANS